MIVEGQVNRRYDGVEGDVRHELTVVTRTGLDWLRRLDGGSFLFAAPARRRFRQQSLDSNLVRDFRQSGARPCYFRHVDCRDGALWLCGCLCHGLSAEEIR